MRKITLILIIFIFIINCFSAIYYYKDDNGNIFITDKPPENDERYKIAVPTRKKKKGIKSSVKEHIQKKMILNENNEYDTIINKYALEFNLSPFLIKAMIRVESNFNRFAKSSSNALGLMQLKESTAKDMGIKKGLFDANENIRCGSKYLKLMHDMFNDQNLAIAAYNVGPGTIKREKDYRHIEVAKNYVEKVKWYYNYYKEHSVDFNEVKKLNSEAFDKYKNNKIKESIDLYENIIKVAPNFPDAYFNLGVIYAEHGMIYASITMYKKAIDKNPYLEEAYYNLAIIYENQNYIENALEYWEKYKEIVSTKDKLIEVKRYIKELVEYLENNN
jgi:tetratricopeptide (TPR) repeat protein